MISRRNFVRVGALALVGGLLATLRSLADRVTALTPHARVVMVTTETANEVTFAEDVIVCRVGGGIRAFSARCTHLGCLITQQADGLLVCPCHGSRFRLDGTVARGPAGRPLEPLAHRLDPKTGAILVEAS